jgi:hypothetical protein
MVRTLTGYAVVAVVGILALKLVFGLLGFAFSILWTVLWLAALGYIIYLILRVVSPGTAEWIREQVRGRPDTES